MTRETKLGITVASTFLALVGGVLGTRAIIRSPEAATKPVAQQPSPTTETTIPSRSEPEVIPASHTEPVREKPMTETTKSPLDIPLDLPSVPAKGGPDELLVKNNPTGGKNPVIIPDGDEQPIIPPPPRGNPPKQSEPKTEIQFGKPTGQGSATKIPADDLLPPLPPPTKTELPPIQIPAPDDKGLPPLEIPTIRKDPAASKEGNKPNVELKLPGKLDGGGATNLVQAGSQTPPALGDPLIPKAPAATDKKELDPLVILPPPSKEEKKAPAEALLPKENLQLNPLPTPKGNPLPQIKDPLQLDPSPAPKAGASKDPLQLDSLPTPMDPKTSGKDPLQLDSLPKRKDLNPIDPKEKPPTVGNFEIRPSQDSKIPTTPSALDPLEIKQPGNSKKDLTGGEGKIDIPPAKELPPAVREKKEQDDNNYDEDLHTLRPNETYRTISKLHYRSESYAIALQKYNQANPGQADYIRIPPIWVLEKRYPNDIASGVQATNYTPMQAVAKPQTPVYIVPGNGEYLAEIAQRTLGSEDAWKRIKDLNPGINEVKKIPAGTRLLMPADARIGP